MVVPCLKYERLQVCSRTRSIESRRRFKTCKNLIAGNYSTASVAHHGRSLFAILILHGVHHGRNAVHSNSRIACVLNVKFCAEVMRTITKHCTPLQLKTIGMRKDGLNLLTRQALCALRSLGITRERFCHYFSHSELRSWDFCAVTEFYLEDFRTSQQTEGFASAKGKRTVCLHKLCGKQVILKRIDIVRNAHHCHSCLLLLRENHLLRSHCCAGETQEKAQHTSLNLF